MTGGELFILGVLMSGIGAIGSKVQLILEKTCNLKFHLVETIILLLLAFGGIVPYSHGHR